jgi:hypothetical protein
MGATLRQILPFPDARGVYSSAEDVIAALTPGDLMRTHRRPRWQLSGQRRAGVYLLIRVLHMEG